MDRKRNKALTVLVLCSICGPGAPSAFGQDQNYDVVVYGGTSGGITAAVQAARLGKSVALVEPTLRIGGMTTNGLGATDSGNGGAIQGLSREYYSDVSAAYGSFSFSFEPKVGLQVFQQWVQTPGITLYTNEQLDLNGGVAKVGSQIQSIRMESGLTLSGSMFIDAGYEGDLMAKAGVSYTIGRESNATYGERWNGVQVGAPGGHQFSSSNPVSAYVVPGNPASGLLPGMEPAPPAPNGSGDGRLQAYNFRLTVTKAANRLPWTAPAGYDPNDYELLRRHIVANGITNVSSLLNIVPTRGGKYDVNNNGAVSTDFIGQNYAYPDADYATRQQIVEAHRQWQQGLMYYLANDASVQSIRDGMKSYGLAPDEFTSNGGWSEQLYIREARRMVGQYVMTDNDVLGPVVVPDSIGLGSYGMDSHHTHRYVNANGHVRNEGDVQVYGFQPYGISYRSLTPLETEASNLLVTSAISASHIAYGSIRMEPVFMIMGQAGGTAAALAIDHNASVQDLDYSLLRGQLISDGALLDWPVNQEEIGQSAAWVNFNDSSSFPTPFRFRDDGVGWQGQWDGTGTQEIVAGDLSYSGGGYAALQTGGGQPGKLRGTYNAPRQNRRTFDQPMNEVIWFSFLARNPDATASAGVSFNPGTNGDPAAGPIERLLVLEGDLLQLTLNGTAVAVGSESLAIAQTHLIVGRLDVVGGIDSLSIWADPSNLADLGPADLQLNDRDLLGVLNSVGLLSYNTSGPAFGANGGFLDAVRLSNETGAFVEVTGMRIPGDFDGDGGVGPADYSLWHDSFGQVGGGSNADADGDGDSDGADFLVWQRDLGRNALANSALGSVSDVHARTLMAPEAPAITLTGIAYLAALAWRRSA